MTKISVIIPTKNRANYLAHTIESALNQNYDDYEIIISDNFSNDHTRDIVEKFKSKKIKYHKSEKELSRTESWNFALSKANGDYITFLGDDDSLCKGSIRLLDKILFKFNVDVITWQKFNYHWPDHIYEERKNTINGSVRHLVTKIKSESKFKLFTRFYERYNSLPCVYNSLVHRKYIDQVKSISQNNVFFGGLIPDVYSGIVLSRVINEYLFAYFPISINGASALSGGVAQAERKKKLSSKQYDQIKDISVEVLKSKYDDRMGYSTSIYSIELGEYIMASKNLTSLKWPEPNWRAYVNALKRETNTSKNPEEIYNAAKYTAKTNNLKFVTFSKKKFKNYSGGDRYLDCNLVINETYIKNSYDIANALEVIPDINDIKINTTSRIFFSWVQFTKKSIIEFLRLYFSKT